MVKTTKEIKDNYIIVTDKWLRKSTSNNHKVIDVSMWFLIIL